MHHLLIQIRMLRKQCILSLKNIFRLGLQSLCLSSWQGKGKECDNSKIHMTEPFTIKTHSEYILYLLLNTQVSRINVWFFITTFFSCSFNMILRSHDRSALGPPPSPFRPHPGPFRPHPGPVRPHPIRQTRKDGGPGKSRKKTMCIFLFISLCNFHGVKRKKTPLIKNLKKC